MLYLRTSLCLSKKCSFPGLILDARFARGYSISKDISAARILWILLTGDIGIAAAEVGGWTRRQLPTTGWMRNHLTIGMKN